MKGQKQTITITRRDPMTGRLMEAIMTDGDYTEHTQQIAALTSEVQRLNQELRVTQSQVREQQVAVLGALNALTQFSNLQGQLDQQAIQMVQGMEYLASRLGLHNFSQSIMGISRVKRNA